MALTRDSLLKRGAIKEIQFPDNGGSVHLKTLPASFFVNGRKNAKEGEDNENLDAPAMILASVCDKNGAPVFRPEDRAAILEMPFADVNFLGREIMLMNGLIKKEEDAATEAEKN